MIEAGYDRVGDDALEAGDVDEQAFFVGAAAEGVAGERGGMASPDRRPGISMTLAAGKS